MFNLTRCVVWQLPLVHYFSTTSARLTVNKCHCAVSCPLMALQGKPYSQQPQSRTFSISSPNTHQHRQEHFSFGANFFSRQISTSLALSDLSPRGAGSKRRSRLVDPRTKLEKRKIKAKEVLVIDETGKNLGEMQTDLAVQIAEGQGLEIVQMQKETEHSKAVFKFISKKQLYEEKKAQKQQSKKDPQHVVKEIALSTKIGPHDLEVKVHRLVQFLEKKHTARVIIEGSFRRYFTETEIAAEKKRQASLLGEVARKLEGVGSKVSKESQQGKKLVCSFKPRTNE